MRTSTPEAPEHRLRAVRRILDLEHPLFHQRQLQAFISDFLKQNLASPSLGSQRKSYIPPVKGVLILHLALRSRQEASELTTENPLNGRGASIHSKERCPLPSSGILLGEADGGWFEDHG